MVDLRPALTAAAAAAWLWQLPAPLLLALLALGVGPLRPCHAVRTRPSASLESASSSAARPLRCCCSNTKGEPRLCRYVVPKLNGRCPMKDLGNGFQQTHRGYSCQVDGTEHIEEKGFSDERLFCAAFEIMESTIFPIETHGGYAIRLAQAGVPRIGDVYTAVEKVEITKAKLSLYFERLDDRTFAFKIQGPSKDGTAIVKAYISGLKLRMPKSKVDKVLQAALKTTQVVRKIFTLGTVDDNYASLENTPIKIRFMMAGHFRLDDDGGWEVIKATREQYAKVEIKSGGALNWLANQLMDNFGGMDDLFYNQIWPHIELLIPPRLGKAFQQVPYETGKVSRQISINARCAEPAEDRCPGQKLRVEARETASLQADPSPIIRDLDSQDFFQNYPLLRQHYHNVAQSYTEGEDVFAGAEVFADVQASLNDEGKLEAAASPTAHVPISAFFSFLGPAVPLSNILPKDGVTQITGGLSIGRGKIFASDLKVDPLVFPVGQHEDFATVSATLEDFGIELEDSTEGGLALENDLIFSKSSPLSIDIPAFEASLGFESGFHFLSMATRGKDLAQVNVTEADLAPPDFDALSDSVKGQGRREAIGPQTIFEVFEPMAGAHHRRMATRVPHNTVQVKLMPPFMEDLFSHLGTFLLAPSNQRTGAVERADGSVPPQWQQPLAVEMQPLDLRQLIDEANVQGNVKITPVSHRTGELLDLKVIAHLNANLSLSNYFWQSAFQMYRPDSGYLHLVAPGTFGKGSRKDLPSAPAVALLSCGWLKIFTLPRSRKEVEQSEPFSSKAMVFRADIRDAGAARSWKRVCNGARCCLRLRRERTIRTFGRTETHFFCTEEANLGELETALGVQAQRMEDAGRRWRGACHPGLNGEEPYCLGNPDGTWFQRSLPLDPLTWFPSRPPAVGPEAVRTPRSEWRAAVTSALKK